MTQKRLHVQFGREKKLKNILTIFAGLFFICLLIYLMKFTSFYNKIYTARKNVGTVTKIPQEKKVFNILLMGYGGPGHEGAYLTDTMMVIHIDLKQRKALLLSIPRDIWVKVPTKSGDDFHAKINSVYQMGLFENKYPDIPTIYLGKQGAGDLIKTVVGQITGLPIDYYAALDFEGFRRAVDILDGVDITITKPLDDFEYPIAGHEDDLCGKTEEDLPELEKIATESPQLAFPCRYEHLHFDAGKTHLDGEVALKFVRSRHAEGDGGDFGRANRQQQFLQAVKEKVISIGFIPKIIPLLDELDTHVRTDIPLEITNKFLGQAKYSGEYIMSTLVLSDDTFIKPAISDDGQYILIPKGGLDRWDDIKTWINQVSEGITPTPSVPQKLRQ